MFYILSPYIATEQAVGYTAEKKLVHEDNKRRRREFCKVTNRPAGPEPATYDEENGDGGAYFELLGRMRRRQKYSCQYPDLKIEEVRNTAKIYRPQYFQNQETFIIAKSKFRDVSLTT